MFAYPNILQNKRQSGVLQKLIIFENDWNPEGEKEGQGTRKRSGDDSSVRCLDFILRQREVLKYFNDQIYILD